MELHFEQNIDVFRQIQQEQQFDNLTIPWPGVPFSFLGGRLWVLHTFYSGNDQNCAKQGFIFPFQHVLDYWKRKEDLKVGMGTF